MRLIAIPLARVRPNAHPVSTFLSQQTKLATSLQDPNHQPPLSTRLLTKASNFWLGLARDGEDGKKLAVFDWKRRTYNLGEKLMDRIEYEEWALKAVDPSLDVSYTKPPTSASDKPPPQEQEKPMPIRLHYPPSLINPDHLLSNLTNLVATRRPHHRSRLIYCCVGMPFTLPFALVPILPNLPFFYLLWRAWSHWKAYRSSDYLTYLISQNRIQPHADEQIDVVFAAKAITPSDQPPQLILSKEHIDQLKTALDLDQQSCNDLVRARQQTQASIEKGELLKLEQAAEGQFKKDQ